MPIRGRSRVALLLVAGMLFLAGCGSSSTSTSSTSASEANTATAANGSGVGALPTAEFVLHAGLAFGAFHRYIYEPFKAGTLTHGLFKHKIALAKAGLAGLFAYHELKLSIADAKASPILSKLLTPVNALAARLALLGAGLKGGHTEAGAIGSTDSGVEALAGQAKQSGLSIGEKVPGASQLAGAL